MREIEFRGKALNREWVYGGYIQSEEVICPKTASIKVFVYPETVGQYTGLESMDGERIFEGDIIKHFPTDLFVVTFEDCAFWAKYKDGRFELSHRHAYWKVIGNIHDNPELLEVGA